MSNQLLASKKTLFTPRDLVSTPVEGKSFLKLYPKRNIGDPWSELENNLAFNVNCSTLQNSNLKKNVIIETLAEQMGTSTQVHIYLQQYESLGKNQFFNPENLKVLSYHNKQGAVIDDATHYVEGIEILKPVDTRPQGIHFVKFGCNLDFSTLGVEATTPSVINFYSNLPISTNVVMEVDGVNYPSEAQIEALEEAIITAQEFYEASVTANLLARTQNARMTAVTLARNDATTSRQARTSALARINSRLHGVNFNGPSNWLETKTSAVSLKTFLFGEVIGSSDLSPFLISKPSFDSNVASKNEKTFKTEFNMLVMDVAFEPLKKVIFNYVCPNLKNEPFQLFKSVCQESQDPEDSTKITRISVQQYVDIFNGLMRSLPSESEWLVDVHEFFIRNLSPELREKMEADGYTAHLESNKKDPFTQIKLIEEARRKALAAEKTLTSQVKMIQDQLKNSHGFFTTASGEQVLFSPAERTIQYYKKEENQLGAKSPPPATPRNFKCWGCGSPHHRWYDRIAKRITCPDGKNPAYIKAAASARERLRLSRLNRANQLKNNSKKNFLEALLASDANIIVNTSDTGSTAGETTSTLSSESNTKAITLNFSNSKGKTESESPKKKVKFTDRKVFNFITHAIYNARNGRDPLPITLHPELPHVKIQLGEPDSSFNPALLGVLDTGATLTVGYHNYILGICEAYPQLVKSIVWAADKYTPIELNGVVDDKDAKQSSSAGQLSAVVTFHMPYLTTNNHNTTFSVAIGKNVAVNVLIGMSFIHSTKLVIDAADNVAESKMLQCPPFEIIYKVAGRSEPNKIPSEFIPDDAVFTAHSNMIQLIKDTKSYLDNDYDDSITQPSLAEAVFTAKNDTDIKNSPSDYNMDYIDTSDISTGITNTLRPNNLKRKSINSEPVSLKKGKYTKKKKPNLFREINLPDELEGFDFLFEKTKGKVISKTNKTVISANDISPEFKLKYNEKIHGKELSSRLKFHPDTSPTGKERITRLIKEYWCCFCRENVPVPIRNYKCHIDTGKSKPTVSKNLRFGMHERPIMQSAIDALLQKGQIAADTESEWLSKPVLAPKPHQEGITGDKIDDFIWRFCISYIALNQVTKVISYPIPRCDDAVMMGIGKARYRISMDAFSGYHQIMMEYSSSLKTAFAGPNGRKYRYLVMPFGIVNGPVIFVIMIHDLKDHWDQLAVHEMKLKLENETNSTIIIDDTFLYSNTLDNIISYFHCVLEISKRYNLSWKLEKCGFLEPRFEFVGIDIADDGNHPAKSKTPLMLMWKDKKPETIRDLSSFLGLTGYYRTFIPFFEEKVRTIRKLIATHEYEYRLTPEDLSEKVINEMNQVLNDLLKDPVLCRPDPNKRFYLRTDACKQGHGNVLLQPSDDEDSIKAMEEEILGGKCQFDLTLKNNSLRLFPIGFSGRKCSTSESYLHSFMNEALAVNFGINQWKVFLWGKEFTILTDCRALIWLLNYEGTNSAVRRLQFEILGYWFTIHHRSASMNADADALSRLGLNFKINPSLQNYYNMADSLKKQYPCVDGVVQANNLPGFRRNFKNRKDSSTHESESVLFATLTNITALNGMTNVPLSVHNVPYSETSLSASCNQLNYQPIASNALKSSTFKWILNRSGPGSFSSVCKEFNLPFSVPLACDVTLEGRSLLQELEQSTKVVNGSLELLELIQLSTRQVQGYFVIVPNSTTPDEADEFLRIQAKILETLSRRCHLVIFIMQIHNEFNPTTKKSFFSFLNSQHWVITDKTLHYTDYNDTIDDSSQFIIAINSRRVGPELSSPIDIVKPPKVKSTIRDNLLAEFNLERYSIMECPELLDENHTHNDWHLTPTKSHHKVSFSDTSRITHHMHRSGDINSNEPGSRIFDIEYPAPPLEPNNKNPFQNLFGIRYKDNNKHFVRSISSYEFCSCFGLIKSIKLKLADTPNLTNLLRHGCPAKTIHTILSACYDRLLEVRNSSLEVDENSCDSQYNNTPITAPAATVLNIHNGATLMKLPTKVQWAKAYDDDHSCREIFSMIKNPGLMTKERLNSIHYRFRQPLRDSNIIIENDFLILREKIDQDSYVKLRIVPKALWNIIFLAFHSNPIGGHFSVYYTFHRIRLRFFWPKMYSYIKHLCRLCAACGLSNSRHHQSKELVYSFPIDAPFKLVICDIYKAGDIAAFDGEKGLFVLLDHMTGFSVIESVTGMNSTSFSKIMMKILLQHGFCHTVVVDADSKFRGVFRDTMSLLKLNVHWASGNNHDSILVERFNLFLNKGLKILCTERSTTRSFVESAQLLTYAWNSAPMAETDISRSLVAVGREFSFPIDFIDQPSPSLTSDVDTKIQYTQELKLRLQSSREVYKILIEEHRSMHREYVNARRPDPFLFNVGDLVWCRRQILSNKKRGIVGKLRFKQTGPWEITEKLQGGSYKLKLVSNHKRIDKKHASDLSIFPHKLIPYPQVSGTDHAYSKINKNITDDPFSEAGIKGYTGYELAQPWQIKQHSSFAKCTPTALLNVDRFPSLQELNDELLKEPLGGNKKRLVSSSKHHCSNNKDTSINNTVVPGPPTKTEESFTINRHFLAVQTLPKTASELMALIIQNEDKLFFIRYKIKSLSRSEWRLVQIDLTNSINKNPSALTNGRVLALFFVSHPNDSSFNATNRRFWKQYHYDDLRYAMSKKYHLVKPDKNEENYCKQSGLLPYSEWINIHDPDVYLVGPFNFATIQGRKTRDRISYDQWKQLQSLKSNFDNDVPFIHETLNGYVCHLDTPYHSEYESDSITASINATLVKRYFDA